MSSFYWFQYSFLSLFVNHARLPYLATFSDDIVSAFWRVSSDIRSTPYIKRPITETNIRVSTHERFVIQNILA